MGQPICHLEINVSNLDNAKKFYGELLGWTFESWGEAPYAMFKTAEGSISGGLSGFGGPMGGGGITYYAQVDEIEPYLEKAKSLGGAVKGEPHLIDENIGWCGFVTDPDGNVVGLFKPAQH